MLKSIRTTARPSWVDCLFVQSLLLWAKYKNVLIIEGRASIAKVSLYLDNQSINQSNKQELLFVQHKVTLKQDWTNWEGQGMQGGTVAKKTCHVGIKNNWWIRNTVSLHLKKKQKTKLTVLSAPCTWTWSTFVTGAKNHGNHAVSDYRCAQCIWYKSGQRKKKCISNFFNSA